MKRTRRDPSMQRTRLLIAAVDTAEDIGYLTMSCSDIADRAGETRTLVHHYLGTMDEIRDAVIRYAITDMRCQILAQAILARHPAVSGLSADSKFRIFEEVSSE